MKKLLLLLLLITIRVKAIENIEINNDNLIPKFDKQLKKYNYFTSKDLVRIKVYKTSDEEIDGEGVHYLENGENKVIITSSNNEKYEINIYKNYEKDDSGEVFIKELNIEGYDINFNKDIHEYNIVINDEDYLKIDYELSNDNASVVVSGNGNFNKSDNIIKINVNDNDEYIIHVLKTITVNKNNSSFKTEEISNTKKEIIIVAIIIISLIVIFLFYYVMFINKTTLSI